MPRTGCTTPTLSPHASALGEPLAFILGLTVFAVPIFLGIRRGPRQQRDRLSLFIIGVYILELIFWSRYDGGRLGMPIIPFVLTFLARGLRSKASRIAFFNGFGCEHTSQRMAVVQTHSQPGKRIRPRVWQNYGRRHRG